MFAYGTGEESAKWADLRITHEQGQQDNGWACYSTRQKVDGAHQMGKPAGARMNQQSNGGNADHPERDGNNQELKDIRKCCSEAKVAVGCHKVLQARREILRRPIRKRGETEYQCVESWPDPKGQQKKHIG
ncbi:MAG TPA: hypothetical protein VKX46_19450 [Ktedonobacteraceae bacterium]|nr:hypothetical protein [Ktedonobacteraceae bacterium]